MGSGEGITDRRTSGDTRKGMHEGRCCLWFGLIKKGGTSRTERGQRSFYLAKLRQQSLEEATTLFAELMTGNWMTCSMIFTIDDERATHLMTTNSEITMAKIF
ncbi:hypothetical protein KP509_07G004500 [Ceratopteris richardii]|uniref:Uncharacterized protein n=1 Tax=Ceratopteris richardii TaxID=49495 RepID=A0A8T2U725_CERRI|nr:hypothetical protein KP509_07G004500 [Ceratopteris richardii]